MRSALIVDDDRQVLALVARWLESSGYLVHVAPSFAQGKIGLNDSPDVLIVDVRLDEFNGIQLAVRARARNPHTCIVVISAWDDPVLKREVTACGARFISKPFDEAQLLDALV